MFFAGRVALLAVLALARPFAATHPGVPGTEAAPAAEGTMAAGTCKTGNQTLFYSPHPLLDARTMAGFGDSLRAQLEAPVRDLGYCLEEVKDYRAVLDTARYGENLVLQTLVREGGGPGTVLVALLRVRELARGRLAEAVSRPLVSLRFEASEASSLPSILAKKISENLRSQYVADLLIQSHPPGAGVRTQAGLEGKTPVEWVMPLGILSVTLEKPGYLPLRRDMDLSAPGLHAYDLQMVKKRFYHSKFIYPTLAAGAVSLAAFALENHYYSEYRALGDADLKTRPQIFKEKFRTAQMYERIGYSAFGMALAGLGLCLTF